MSRKTEPQKPAGDPASADHIRIDKWLWFARVVKSRTLAAKLVAAGNVRIAGQKIAAPKHLIQIGDTLTISLNKRIKVLKVLQIGERRGPASEAQTLYEDLSPVAAKSAPDPAERAKPVIGPKPTRKERQQHNTLRGRI